MSNPGQNHWFFSCLTVCFGWTIRPFHGSDVLTSLSLRSEWNLKILAESVSRKPTVFSIISFAKCIYRNFRDRAQAPVTSSAPSALVSAWMKIERSRLFCYSVIKFHCCSLTRKLLYIITTFCFCQELFYYILFLILNSIIKSFLAMQLVYIIMFFVSRQALFYFFQQIMALYLNVV